MALCAGYVGRCDSFVTTAIGELVMSANRPVHEIRFGHVKAAIWANESDGYVRHNVTLQRLYKDGDDWKTSQSFGDRKSVV
jgi:hypothetical protein